MSDIPEDVRATCATCVYFCPHDAIPVNRDLLPNGFGECRRHAPHGLSATIYLPTEVADEYKAALKLLYPFPPVPPSDWCGEWQGARHARATTNGDNCP